MPLNEQPEEVEWPETHYCYVQRVGAIQESAPACWKELHTHIQDVKQTGHILTYFSAFQLGKDPVYRAGVGLQEPLAADQLPIGLSQAVVPSGKYLRFTLLGSYSQLPEACGRVFALSKEMDITLRDAFFIENYANNPETTPVDELVTHIMLPIA